MSFIRWLIRFFCGIVILIAGSYTMLAICVGGLIIFGRLSPGQAMFFDTNTPTLFQALTFAAIGSLVVAGCAVIRGKFAVRPDGPGDSPRSSESGRA